MARRYKFFQSNETYFITFSIYEKKNIFIEEKYAKLVYKWFDYIKIKYGNKIRAYVIMPNHVHALIYITNKSPEPSVLIMNAKRFMAYEIVKYLEEDNKHELLNFFAANARTVDRAKHRVFSDRYDSQIIQSEKFYLQKLNYIHYNPLQEHWQLVKNPEDYIYSSASNYILGRGAYEVEVIYS
jgi:REP element-mobilizing transposase RayT